MTAATSGDTTLGVVEQLRLLENILQKLMFKETVGTPARYEMNGNIKDHISKIDDYLDTCEIKGDHARIAVLFNSLPDEVRFELCGVLEFEDNGDDYAWITKKLIELFHPKESEISPLVKLFSCKQRQDQSTRDFLSEIRRHGYVNMKAMDPKTREKHMVKAFTKGLYNGEVRDALEQIKIESLDQAYNAIKREKSKVGLQSNDTRVSAMRESASDIEKLQNQMLIIQKQLSFIVDILQSTKGEKTYAGAVKKNIRHGDNNNQNTPRWPAETRQGISRRPQAFGSNQNRALRCWICDDPNHIARFCPQVCGICGKQGHSKSRCFWNTNNRPNRNTRGRHIRRFREADDAEDWEGNETVESQSTNSEESRFRDRNTTAADIQVMTLHNTRPKTKNSYRKQNANTKHLPENRIRYPERIIQLSDYIEGKTNRFPKSETVISKSHPEGAANKPIVYGKCHGKNEKLFCDTGAEINVIDADHFRSIQHNKAPIKLHKAGKIIRCANNSKMNVMGWARLEIEIGSSSRLCKVWVVPNLFPRVILGIRALKDLNVKIDPPNDCVEVEGEKIKFLSRTQPQSARSQTLVN